MNNRHLLSILDLSRGEIAHLLRRAKELKGVQVQSLAGQVLGLLFEKPSLRTRVSFEVAIHQLGGTSLFLSPAEVGLGKREAVADVARVLSRYVQGIVVRTFSQQVVEELAHYSSVPVINALTDHEHPCQALADLLTLQERKGRLDGLTLSYVGDGNNVARSLLLACSLMGVNFHMASPPGYELDGATVDKARGLATQSGARLLFCQEPQEAVAGADAVYTDVWTSMGQEAEAQRRRRDFRGYQVNPELLARAKGDALFLHPLPAHPGEEIAPGMQNHPRSVVFDQAENRLHLQKALLAEMLGIKEKK